MSAFDFKCLQIGNTDLVGNKFNGHNLSVYLKEFGIISYHLVAKKYSNDENTYVYPSASGCNFTEAIIKDKLFLDADIIHFHLIHCTKFDINYLPLFATLKPTVITLHDAFFTTGHCLYSSKCEKWKSFCCDCKNLDTPFKINKDETSYNFLSKKLAIQNSNISAIVASDYMEDIVKQSPIWEGKKIYKVPFGINQKIFKPKDKLKAKMKLGIDKNSIVIMFRATKNPFKGLKYIKKALYNLKTDKKITLLTVETKGLLKEFESRFEIKEYSWIYEDEKLAEIYQAADLFLMPSDEEAFGMMAIEAMSSGVPVLSIKGTSLEKVTNSPVCGLCVENGEFVKALQYLIDNLDEVKARGENSLKYAETNYNKDVYVNKIIEVYKDVIARHKQNMTDDEKLTVNQLKKYGLKTSNASNSSKNSTMFPKRKNQSSFMAKIFGIKIKTKLKR